MTAQAVQIVESREVTTLAPHDLLSRRKTIHTVLSEVMQENVHYGVTPGTRGYSLYKPGAEVLCSTFLLAPRYVITRTDLGGGHREYEIRTTLYYTPTQEMLGEGVGSCSTMEKKYRYRNGNEHPDIADTYNTVLKMAKKRSLVDAILTTTAASDMFNPPDDVDEDDERRPLQSQGPGAVVTQQQIGFLMGVCKQFGVTEEQLHAHLATLGLASRKDIPKAKLDEVLGWVKAQKKDGAE